MLDQLLDHLVGKLLELRWDIKAECRGGLEVDHQIELLRPLYRQVTWLGTVQDFRGVLPASSEDIEYVGPVSNQAAIFWKFAEQRNEGKPFGQRELADLLRSNEHEWGRQQDTGFSVPCLRDLKGTLEVIRAPHFHNFRFECERPCHRLRGCELRHVEVANAEDSYAREPGNEGLVLPGPEARTGFR